MTVTDIVNKVHEALHRRGSSSSSSSSDIAPSPSGSPGPKQEARERHAKLAQTLETAVDNSAKATTPGAESGTIQNSAIAPGKQVSRLQWFREFYSEDELENLFAHEHMGE
ncbi:hypothetical protein FS749_013837 [Ceratobasidium sp. UAMH 11750]|nr:hypothetical protein FS749_013837 [Ceratobasidium sp. UAMH 11750]